MRTYKIKDIREQFIVLPPTDEEYPFMGAIKFAYLNRQKVYSNELRDGYCTINEVLTEAKEASKTDNKVRGLVESSASFGKHINAEYWIPVMKHRDKPTMAGKSYHRDPYILQCTWSQIKVVNSVIKMIYDDLRCSEPDVSIVGLEMELRYDLSKGYRRYECNLIRAIKSSKLKDKAIKVDIDSHLNKHILDEDYIRELAEITYLGRESTMEGNVVSYTGDNYKKEKPPLQTTNHLGGAGLPPEQLKQEVKEEEVYNPLGKDDAYYDDDLPF